MTEIRTYTWHSGIIQRCNNRFVHFVLSMSIQTLESFITPEITQTLFLERSWLHCHVIVLLRRRFNDRVRVLIKLRTALACHWPGVTPRNSPCPVTIGVTGGYEAPSPLSLGSQASNSPRRFHGGTRTECSVGLITVAAGVRFGSCPSMRRAVTVGCSRAPTVKLVCFPHY